MKDMIREMLTDESGKYSSTRAQSIWLMGLGSMTVLVGFVLMAFGIKDVTGYVSMVIAVTFAKSASDVWAGQSKSATVGSQRDKGRPPAPRAPQVPSKQPASSDQKP